MAQTGFTPIQLYYSTTASTAPTAGNLANGELAINITDGKLFYKDNGGVVQVLATKGAGTIGGSNTQVQYNSSGALAGSANLTFDGTTLTANALTVSNAVTLSAGTANGVAYLNGSKVLTTGSALTFDGTKLVASGGNEAIRIASGAPYYSFYNAAQTTQFGYIQHNGTDLALVNVQNGAMPFYVNNAERARIDSSGNLLVGTTSSVGSGPSMTLKCPTAGQQCYTAWNATTSGNPYFHEFGTEGTYTARGSITYNRGAGLVAYNVTSDYRAKDIYGPVVDSGALIDSVPVYMGKMKGATQERPMFIAHETPDYAHTGEKDAVDADGNPVYQQMDASALVPVMWAEIQSLRKRLAAAGI